MLCYAVRASYSAVSPTSHAMRQEVHTLLVCCWCRSWSRLYYLALSCGSSTAPDGYGTLSGWAIAAIDMSKHMASYHAVQYPCNLQAQKCGLHAALTLQAVTLPKATTIPVYVWLMNERKARAEVATPLPVMVRPNQLQLTELQSPSCCSVELSVGEIQLSNMPVTR